MCSKDTMYVQPANSGVLPKRAYVQCQASRPAAKQEAIPSEELKVKDQLEDDLNLIRICLLNRDLS